MISPTAVKHRYVSLGGGVSAFHREAGPEDAPVVLLPHGYPCSSYEFRNFMPLLADHWRVLAPDFPGCGYSNTPDDFPYDFNGFTDFLEKYIDHMNVDRFALYLHDFGSQIGLRLAMRRPESITGLIIQNGDIYEDALGPKYEGLKAFFRNPSPQEREKLREAVSLHGYREEYLNAVRTELADIIPPDLWHLHWSLTTPRRREIATDVIASLKDNLAWFPRYQSYLRERHPPALIVWGPQDGYMPEESARAYLRDLPEAELHLLDGGHWLLETNLLEVADIVRAFLSRLELSDT